VKIQCVKCLRPVTGSFYDHYENEHHLVWVGFQHRWVQLVEAHSVGARARWAKWQLEHKSGRLSADIYRAPLRGIVIELMEASGQDRNICSLCGKTGVPMDIHHEVRRRHHQRPALCLSQLSVER
jgi:hypothetical protein